MAREMKWKLFLNSSEEFFKVLGLKTVTTYQVKIVGF